MEREKVGERGEREEGKGKGEGGRARYLCESECPIQVFIKQDRFSKGNSERKEASL